VAGSAAHIPFSRFHAALSAGDLTFVRRHRASFTLGLVDEIRIAELTASQDPGGLEAQAVTFVQLFAAEAPRQELEDYVRLVTACRTMSSRSRHQRLIQGPHAEQMSRLPSDPCALVEGAAVRSARRTPRLSRSWSVLGLC
jgi:hypothetical protein